MPLDPQTRNLLDLFAADPDVTPVQSLTPDALRHRLRQSSRAFAGKAPAIASAQDLTLPGTVLPARLYRPDAPNPPTTVFFHGGGWVAGDLDTHDVLCRTLCHHARTCVVAVDYRLAPEHPFPAAVDDAIQAMTAIAGHAAELGLDVTRLALAGDSAGGNLAAVASQHARHHGPALCVQLLIYPATDTVLDTPSYAENAHGYALERDDMRWFFDHYAPDPDDPRAAPRRAAELANLPPAIIVTAGYDPLRDDGRAYAAALIGAGNQVDYREHHGLIHGFANLGGVSEASRHAVHAAARALGAALSA